MLIARDGLVLAGVLCAYIIFALRMNPRVFLRQYPESIRAAVAPNTRAERSSALFLSLGLLLILWTGIFLSERHLIAARGSLPFAPLALHGFLVGAVFDAADWLILDELLIGLIRPRWALMPGAENCDYPFDHGRHFRGFLIGLVLCLAFAALAAWLLT